MIEQNYALDTLGLVEPSPTASPRILLIETGYSPPPRDEVLKNRLVSALRRDQSWPRWGPGKWAFGRLRRLLGGRVVSSHFRRLIDDLIAAGMIVEIWETANGGGRRQHRHVIILTDRWHEARFRRIVRIKARDDVLRRLGLIADKDGRLAS
jgi:hypothetical protein